MVRFSRFGATAVALGVMGCCVNSVWAEVSELSVRITASVSARLHDELLPALSRAAEGEFLPVVIVMRDQAPRQQIDAAVAAAPNMAARRQAVTALLKAAAEGSQRDILAMLNAGIATGGVARVHPMWISSMVGADLTAAMVLRVAQRADVDFVIYDPPNPDAWIPAIPGDPSGPDALGIECGVDLMGAPRVWDELNITGRGAVISATDSGSCYNHPDLRDHLYRNPGEIPDNNIDDDDNGYVDDVIGWDFENNDKDPMDSLGHGTHVAGTMAGDGTDGTQTGMAPDAAIMIQRIGSERGIVREDVWESMEYSVDNNVRLQGMSFGWNREQANIRATWRTNCRNAIAGGVTLVIAAGNEGTCCPPTWHTRTPGDVPEVITAGATDCNDVIAGFSSRGPVQWGDVPGYNDFPYPPGLIKPTAAAPGVNTVSCNLSGCRLYVTMSGTSMATPHISGTVGLMLEANPEISPEEIKQILEDTAVDKGAPGKDNEYGAGRVNAYEAVLASLVDPEPAACCFDDGLCEDLLRSDCIDREGRYNFGETCGAFSCPQPGACCITNSDCEVLLERDCLSRGGNFLGEGEACFRACPCDKIKKMKASCKGSGTIKAQVKFRDESFDGQTIKIGVGDRLRFDVVVHGKVGTLFTCCFNGPQQISLLEPEGCLQPKVVQCPE